MSSNRSSKFNSPVKTPQRVYSRDFFCDPDVEFETELNRNLGK